MNIAIINVVGYQKSTGKIAAKLAEIYSAGGHAVRVFYGREDKPIPGYVKINSELGAAVHFALQRVTGKEGYYSYFQTRNLERILADFAPDLAILLNLHGHYLHIPHFMNYLAEQKVPTVYFMCDEYPYTACCSYADGCDFEEHGCVKCQKKKHAEKIYQDKKRYYGHFGEQIRYASPQYQIDRSKKSELLDHDKLRALNTGINTDFYIPYPDESVRQKWSIPKEKVCLLDVAPFSNTRKGVSLFLSAAEALSEDERFVFVNVGYDGPKEKLPKNFIGIPFVSNQVELRALYSLADCYVCTSLRDALPNACVEAMSCGTPVLAFHQSGMVFMGEEPVVSFCGSTSSGALVEAIQRVNKKDEKISSLCREHAIEDFSFHNFAETIMNLYDEIKGKKSSSL